MIHAEKLPPNSRLCRVFADGDSYDDRYSSFVITYHDDCIEVHGMCGMLKPKQVREVLSYLRDIRNTTGIPVVACRRKHARLAGFVNVIGDAWELK